MATFTVFGAAGWIGASIVRNLASKGHEVQAATRTAWPEAGQHLSHVIFTIGLTADFRGRPIETARSHVGILLEALERYRYDSFLYFSSTRVYRGAAATTEDAALIVNPSDPDDGYNITKLAGESICLSLRDERVRVIRLSNVIGRGDLSNNFLSAVIAEARQTGRVLFRTSPNSEKDYIGLDDIVKLIEPIAIQARERLYNVASGRNVTHREIADLIVRELGADVAFSENAAKTAYPQISIDRIRREFSFAPVKFEDVVLDILNSRPSAATLPDETDGITRVDTEGSQFAADD
jgi:nucleoside-diphosphate-sugar epimerase